MNDFVSYFSCILNRFSFSYDCGILHDIMCLLNEKCSGPHAGVGQFSSGEVGSTLNYFGTHHRWSNLIGPHLASLFQPLIICHLEVERH